MPVAEQGRSLPQVQMVQGCPQVDHVAVPSTAGIKAPEDIGVEVDAEGAAPAIATMDGAGTAVLRTAAAQARRQTKMVHHPRQRHRRGDMPAGSLVVY